MPVFQKIALAGIAAIVIVELLSFASGKANTVRGTPGRSNVPHKIFGRMVLILPILLLVGIVEFELVLGGGLGKVDALLVTHICFAILFLPGAILLNTKKFNGEENPRWHGRIAITTLIISIGMLTTAISLVSRLR